MLYRSLKIKKIYNCTITAFLGEEYLQAVEVTNQETKEKSIMKTDGVFIAIGQKPNTEFLKNKVELSDWGYVVKKKNNSTVTSVEGIFAAGDVADPFYQKAIVAAADDCKAAPDAKKYLSKMLLE